MSKTACCTVLLVLTLFLLLPAAASAETKETPAARNSPPKSAKTSKAPSKLPIQSITLVNADEIAREVGKEASIKAQASKGTTRTSGKAQPGQQADGAVQEFHAVNAAPLADSSAGTYNAKRHKHSVLKNVHGSIYGATASGAGHTNTVDGAVGAGSKSGKFNIYVEGAHTHASTPTAH